MRIQFFFLLFFVLLWGGGPGVSRAAVAAPVQDQAQAKTSVPPLEIRSPDTRKLQELRASKDFQYQQDLRPDLSFWERFWRRVGEYLTKIMRTKSYDGFWKYVLYALAIGFTVYLILKLIQVDFVGLFRPAPPAAALTYEAYRENIHELDFDALLEEAQAQGDYRRAIRLHYLRTLKTLTDGGLIDWRPGKTNWSYVSELRDSPLRAPFERLTQAFEYVWYGGGTLPQQQFIDLKKLFEVFDHSLTSAA